MPPKPVTQREWLRSHTPSGNDRAIERAWLSEHWLYGGRIHEETGAALIAALEAPSEPAVGHSLYLRLFAEYANALETAGAWGWIIRTRRDYPLVLDGFLTYPHNAPRLFYTAARRNRSRSLVRLLNLPPEDRVVSALEPAMPEWTVQECRQSLTDAVRQAKFLAERYFAEDEVIRSTYNRAKHGATILHHASLTPRQFYVLAPDLRAGKRARSGRYQLNKFTVNARMIRSLEHGIEIAGSMVRYLAGLARALSEADMLYPRRRQRT